MTNLSNKLSLLPNRTQSRKLKGIIAALTCSLSFSCENPALYDQYQAINNITWEKDKEYYETIPLTFIVQDTRLVTISNEDNAYVISKMQDYDLTLEVRNNNLYPYQNLWLFCSEEQPIGPLRRDTIECMLADEFGKWHGHGISLYQSSFPIHSQYKFPHAGQYTFSFRQGMRDDALKGIQEIGFSVRLSR